MKLQDLISQLPTTINARLEAGPKNALMGEDDDRQTLTELPSVELFRVIEMTMKKSDIVFNLF